MIQGTFSQRTNDWKMKSCQQKLQIMFYNIHNSYQGTSFHIRNVADIYEKYNTRELITSFNRSSLCDGYKTMKRYSSNLAKHAVVHGQGKEWNITLSSHFSPSSFTVAAFDHSDKYTLSANTGVHDTAVMFFRKNQTNLCKNRWRVKCV